MIKKKINNSCSCSKSKYYKFIFMDIDMPIKDGFETTTDILEFF